MFDKKSETARNLTYRYIFVSEELFLDRDFKVEILIQIPRLVGYSRVGRSDDVPEHVEGQGGPGHGGTRLNHAGRDAGKPAGRFP